MYIYIHFSKLASTKKRPVHDHIAHVSTIAGKPPGIDSVLKSLNRSALLFWEENF